MLLSLRFTHLFPSLVNSQTTFVIYGSLAVGIAIFITAITNTEHPPAAGIALGLVLNKWDTMTIVFILGAILWMAALRRLLKPFLMDLISLH